MNRSVMLNGESDMDRTLLKAWGLLLALAFAFWLPAAPARAAGSVPEAR